MFSHSQIWQAIDRLAESNGMSASGLARAAGLDATSFNKSKRTTPHGKPRWPTTESIAKCLSATRTSLNDFAGLVNGVQRLQRAVPCIQLSEAGASNMFDDDGRPAGDSWNRIELFNVDDPCAYALHIRGDAMMPVYRDGDTVIVSPAAPVRPGDGVVVKTRDGELLTRRLLRDTGATFELACFNPQLPVLVIERDDIKWMARIVWTSQ